MRVFYFCNGENPNCGHTAGCYKHGGVCVHTANREYAKTPECKEPWKYPNRFDAERIPGGEAYYFEREETTSEESSE